MRCGCLLSECWLSVTVGAARLSVSAPDSELLRAAVAAAEMSVYFELFVTMTVCVGRPKQSDSLPTCACLDCSSVVAKLSPTNKTIEEYYKSTIIPCGDSLYKSSTSRLHSLRLALLIDDQTEFQCIFICLP